MLHAYTSSLKTSLMMTQPALTENKKFTKTSAPIDQAAIILRTAIVFASTMALAFPAFKNFSENGLISSEAYNKLIGGSSAMFIVNPYQAFLIFVGGGIASLPVKLSAPLCLAGLVAFVMNKNENWRASGAALLELKNQFDNADEVVDQVLMDYVLQHPSTLNALIQLIPEKILKTTSKEGSRTLLQSILHKSSESEQLDENHLSCFHPIIDHLARNKKELADEDFLLMLKHKRPDFALYALHKEVVKQTPSSEEVIACVKAVKNTQVAEKLFEYPGYKAHIVDPNGIVLLSLITEQCNPMSSATAEDIKKIILLFKSGAVCKEDTLTTIWTDSNDETSKPIREWLKGRPQLIKTIEQFQTQQKEKITKKHPSSSFFDPRKIPVILSKNTMMIDYSAIVLQTATIAATVFGATVVMARKVATKFEASIALGTAASLIIGALFARYMQNKATQSLDDAAVEQFMNTNFHNPIVTKYLCNTPSAMAALIMSNPTTLLKQDANGVTLWEAFIKEERSFESFTKLADQLFVTATDNQKAKLFALTLEASNVKYAHYIIDKKLIEPSKITPFDACKCWTSCNTMEALKLLKENKINVNVKDKKGYTPLLHVAHRYVNSHITKYDYIKALLEAGANTEATVCTRISPDSEEKDLKAVDFLSKSEQNIIDLITKHSKKE